tara:strand:- start:101 stop:565 length:465 start_codon:yes stop_codon:yes gene_type:complete
MPYIHKTLSEGEVIEQFLKYHWFFMIYPIFLLIIGLSIAISHFLYFSNLIEGNLVLYLSYLFFIFSFIKFITRFIERWTTEQALTNKRVFRKVGLIRRDTDELVYEKIETVAVKQSILGRIFNFGEVEFTGTGGMYIRFIFVKDPTKVKRNFKH